MRTTGRMAMVAVLAIVAMIGLVAGGGCKLLSGDPGKFDEALYAPSNTVVTTTARTTNAAGVVLPAGSLVTVPQLGAKTATAESASAAAGLVGNLFGAGGLIGTAVAGLFGWYQRARNAGLVAKYTGATEAVAAANQVSVALSQNIETILELMEGSPQLKPVVPLVKNYLMKHQTEAGVVKDVSRLIAEFVNTGEAKGAAMELAAAINQLGQPAAGPNGARPNGAIPMPGITD